MLLLLGLLVVSLALLLWGTLLIQTLGRWFLLFLLLGLLVVSLALLLLGILLQQTLLG